MEKTNSTFFIPRGSRGISILKSYFYSLSLFTLCLFTAQNLSAQDCTLGCSDANISLGADCNAEVTPDMVANATGGCSTLTVELFYLDDTPVIGSPYVDASHLGMTLIASVVDSGDGNNSCWSYITIEDKMKPTFQCPDIVEISCVEMLTYPAPSADDNCDSNPTEILVGYDEEALSCDPDFVKMVTRKYIAVDASGNVSDDTCTQIILLERFDIEDIDMPDAYLVVDNTDLACDGDYPLDANGNPHPSFTGIPSYDGVNVWPDGIALCNVMVSYSDLNIPTFGCVEKVMRTWTAREWWCSDEIEFNYVQIIEISDEKGPDIECPNIFDVTTDGISCTGDVYIPAAIVSDACSEPVTVTVTYPGGVADQNGGFTLSLPVGVNEIIYTAYDDCLNSSTCSVFVTVTDDTPPVPICDLNTTVSLGGDGNAVIYWQTFDDGSYDDCEIDYIQIRRMSDNCGINGNTSWGEYVTFCCADVGEDVLVELRVVDISGNVNQCMVTVEVQDKIGPSITCPPNITVNCDYPIDYEDLSEFGSVVLNSDDRDSIFVNGEFWGFDGLATDNCGASVTSDYIENIDNCGEGYIRRRFTATGAGGNPTVCFQYIYIENDDPFNGYEDITWPQDYTTYTGCDAGGLTPDDLPAPYDYPVWTEDACDLVGISFEDWVFHISDPNDEACFKILRKWKIIDWCDFEDGEYTVYEHEQVIKVGNTSAPEYTTSCDDLSVDTYDTECEDGYIELVQAATDDCTAEDDLYWSYSIDVGNNGEYEITGASNDASGYYPIGNYRIVWTVEDLCGNKTTCEHLFEIVNRKQPTPYVVNGLAADLMPIDTDDDGVPDEGMLEIWASDFDAGSFHVCGYDITLSFSDDPTDQSVTFTCADLGQQVVEIWVTDENGNQDFVITYIIIQDNNNACDDNNATNGGVIAGTIKTETDQHVGNAQIELMGSPIDPTISSNSGSYSFPTMSYGGSYEVIPEKNDDLLNGVTTYDLVLIQKHILGLDQFTSPYKMIAADIDHNNKLTAIDLVELRKTILGVNNSFPNNQSWRFVESNFEFNPNGNPLLQNFPESYTIDQFTNTMVGVDFLGIKVGDLNDNVVANDLNIVEDRSDVKLNFVTADQSLIAGKTYTVPFTAEDFNNMLAYQFTLEFNTNALSYEGFESGSLQIDEQNFGLQHVENGKISTSWNDIEGQNQNGVLFTMVFTAKDDVMLSDVLNFGSTITPSAAYGTQTGEMDVELTFSTGAQTIAGFELYQNQPNPFTVETVIGFDLPEAMMVDLQIFDVTGKTVKVITGQYNKGYNEIKVNSSEIDAAGVLYYQMNTKNYTATKKMILVK